MGLQHLRQAPLRAKFSFDYVLNSVTRKSICSCFTEPEQKRALRMGGKKVEAHAGRVNLHTVSCIRNRSAIVHFVHVFRPDWRALCLGLNSNTCFWTRAVMRMLSRTRDGHPITMIGTPSQ